jgi:hypothetical protein
MPAKGYRHHSPKAAAPGAAQQPGSAPRRNGSLTSSGLSSGTPSLPPVGALDLTASTVLVTAGGAAKGGPLSPSGGAAADQAHGRPSCDSNSSGQSWELVPGDGGSGGTVSPA